MGERLVETFHFETILECHLWWEPLYLLKITRVCCTHKLVGMTRGFIFLLLLEVVCDNKRPCLGVFLIMERENSPKMIRYVFMHYFG